MFNFCLFEYLPILNIVNDEARTLILNAFPWSLLISKSKSSMSVVFSMALSGPKNFIVVL